MMPLSGGVDHITQQSAPGEVSRGSAVEFPVDSVENDFANESFEAQSSTGASSPQEPELAGAKEEDTADVSLTVATKPRVQQ